MMKKRLFTILMTAVLALTYAAGPVCYAAASEGATNEVAEEAEENIPEEAAEEEPLEAKEGLPEDSAGEDSDKSLLEQGKEIGEDLYKKMDEAIDGVDKGSLRKSIREALEEMDELGISREQLLSQGDGRRRAAVRADGAGYRGAHVYGRQNSGQRDRKPDRRV